MLELIIKEEKEIEILMVNTWKKETH